MDSSPAKGTWPTQSPEGAPPPVPAPWPAEEREARVKDIVKRLRFKGPVFEISALTREGCERLVQTVYEYLAKEFRSHQPDEVVDPRFADGPDPRGL